MLLNKYIAYLVKSFYPVTFLHSYFFRVCMYVRMFVCACMWCTCRRVLACVC